MLSTLYQIYYSLVEISTWKHSDNAWEMWSYEGYEIICDPTQFSFIDEV